MTITAQLTRAEDAYAHLASFQRGDLVDVAADRWHASATVTEAQRDGWNLEAAYLVIDGPQISRAITVRDLTHSRITITARAAQNS